MPFPHTIHFFINWDLVFYSRLNWFLWWNFFFRENCDGFWCKRRSNIVSYMFCIFFVVSQIEIPNHRNVEFEANLTLCKLWFRKIKKKTVARQEIQYQVWFTKQKKSKMQIVFKNKRWQSQSEHKEARKSESAIKWNKMLRVKQNCLHVSWNEFSSSYFYIILEHVETWPFFNPFGQKSSCHSYFKRWCTFTMHQTFFVTFSTKKRKLYLT